MQTQRKSAVRGGRPSQQVAPPGSAAVLFMTGTGNTARAAALIAAGLAGAGWTVHSAELRRRRGPSPSSGDFTEDLLVLCFPVLGFGMPSLVRKLLKHLRGNGRPAAVFATWGGEGSAALCQARWFLRRRGFCFIDSSGAAYPFQWTQVVPAPQGDDARRMVAAGDATAVGFAKALVGKLAASNLQRVARKPDGIPGVLLGLPVSWLYTWIGRSGLGAMYAADGRCKACGNCVRDCPAGAIFLAGSGPARRPRWRARCEGCNRCINLCPRASVQVSPLRAVTHLLLNVAAVAAIVFGLNGAAFAISAPALIQVPAYIAALLLLVVAGSRLQFAGLEPVLFALESRPAIRGLISRSWTVRFPRYRCEGFRPAREGIAPDRE